jgi:hypothetical protein
VVLGWFYHKMLRSVWKNGGPSWKPVEKVPSGVENTPDDPDGTG